VIRLSSPNCPRPSATPGAASGPTWTPCSAAFRTDEAPLAPLAVPPRGSYTFRRREVLVMQSPFPGMDPYLEQHWGAVHHNLITVGRGLLNELLPPDLRARVQERVVVDLPSEDRTYYPDVRVVEHERPRQGGMAVATSDVSLAEPLEVPFLEPETQGFIE